MKTLLEFLEENRSKLKNGIYSVSGMGNLIFNNAMLDSSVIRWRELAKTDEKYVLHDGEVTRITWGIVEDDESVRESHNGKKENKYNRQCKGITIDVYDVLKAFAVTDPALQHLIKKALCAGLRGHKNKEQDLIDIYDSAKRALELYNDD